MTRRRTGSSESRSAIRIICKTPTEQEKAMTLKNVGQATQVACDNLVKQLQSSDNMVRTLAWHGAGTIGAAAVAQVSELVTHKDVEVSRAAKRALREICRVADQPRGVQHALDAVVAELLLLLDEKKPLALRRHVLWLLADIAGDEAVPEVASILSDAELREDARMVLEHIPGAASLAALKKALRSVPDDFKINVVQSLRARGVKVDGYPCKKMVPVKETKVAPVGEK